MLIFNIAFIVYTILVGRFLSPFGIILLTGLFFFVQLMQCICFFGDPGLSAQERIEFEDPLTEEQAVNYYCKECDIIRWAEVHHCEKCGVCVSSWRVHSKLVGKCIGEKNVKYYRCMMYGLIVFLIMSIIQIFAMKKHIERMADGSQ